MTQMKRMIFITVLLCCAALGFNGVAVMQPVKLGGSGVITSPQATSTQVTNPTVTNPPVTNPTVTNPTITKPEPVTLKQDSGTNLSKMNFSLTFSPTFGSAQTVKFTAPNAGWKIQGILIMATDGWNATSKVLPKPLPFAIEIRDSDLRLLYHYADTQLPYFTAPNDIRMADVEVPDVSVSGDFYVCFYGYRSLGLATELQNSTGNSYIFDKLAGELYSYKLPLRNNQTLPINFLIRVIGE